MKQYRIKVKVLDYSIEISPDRDYINYDIDLLPSDDIELTLNLRRTTNLIDVVRGVHNEYIVDAIAEYIEENVEVDHPSWDDPEVIVTDIDYVLLEAHSEQESYYLVTAE